MLQNLTIGTRLSLGFGLVLVIVLALVVPVVIIKISDVVHEAEQKELSNLYQSARAEIESEGRLAQAMSHIIASVPEMQQAVAQAQRDELATRAVPLFKDLKERFAVEQFQFHTPPAISFLRAHKPEKFGDDLSSFRNTIVAANRDKKPVQGLEKGVAGLGIRGISPVFYQTRHVGSVEFGMSFGQAFFDKFKAKYNADIALHVDQDGRFSVFGSTFGDKALLTQIELNAAMNGKEQVRQLLNGEHPYAVYGRSIEDYSGNPVGVLEIAIDRGRYMAQINSARNLILLIDVSALMIGLLIAWLISCSITKPLANAVSAMNDIAQGDGDLTKRLRVQGQNEIAQLAQAFNQFAEKVRQIVTQVAGSTTQLAAAAEQMATITQQTNENVQQQQMETEQVATAMNEMTATVQEVARHATEASAAAKSADEEATGGKEVVANTVSTIDTLANEIETATTVINKVEKESEKIGAVLDVIRGIAEQTNLLALNAAIEAARAGEQGRGFAVVADEVRTLASRTQESTQEIHAMIESLQQESREAVHAMEYSRERSQNSVKQAALAGESLNAITNAVTAISDMNIQIAAAAEQQSCVADEINKNINNIAQVVHRTADGAQQIFSSSNELARLSADLQQLVNQFKT